MSEKMVAMEEVIQESTLDAWKNQGQLISNLDYSKLGCKNLATVKCEKKQDAYNKQFQQDYSSLMRTIYGGVLLQKKRLGFHHYIWVKVLYLCLMQIGLRFNILLRVWS